MKDENISDLENGELDGRFPDPSPEPERPTRKHLVESAGYWFTKAREAQRQAGKMADAMMSMENAYNHVENALLAMTEERDKLKVELDEAIERVREFKSGEVRMVDPEMFERVEMVKRIVADRIRLAREVEELRAYVKGIRAYLKLDQP